MSKAKTAAGAVALALVLFGMSGGAEADAAQPPTPEPTPDFEPFYVGTPRPGELEVDHIIRYAPTPQAGLVECLDELSYYTQDTPEASADCQVQPESSAPDLSDPNWIDEFAPSWAGGS